MRLRKRDLVWQNLDDEVVALDLAASTYLRINGSGALLWRQLETSATRDQLVDALAGRFDLTREQAAADVERFVGSLRDRGLLEV